MKRFIELERIHGAGRVGRHLRDFGWIVERLPTGRVGRDLRVNFNHSGRRKCWGENQLPKRSQNSKEETSQCEK